MTIDTYDVTTQKDESTALWVVNQEEEKEEPYEDEDYEDEDEEDDEDLGGTEEGGSGQSEELY